MGPLGVKISDIWDNCRSFTEAASDAARQLSFAGIAVVWLFKSDAGGALHLDVKLIFAATCFVVALAFDLMQYAIGYVTYYILGRWREWRYPDSYDAKYPSWINWPIDTLFRLKLVAVISGYVVLFGYLVSRLT